MDVQWDGLMHFSWTLVFNIITVLVLFLILSKFFFKKIHNAVLARENDVRNTLDNAESTNRKADIRLNEYEERLAKVEAEGREILRQSKLKADGQAQDIIDEANDKVMQMLEKARQDIAREQDKAIHEMEKEISELALLVAEKIMNKELQKSNEQEKIVEEVIEEAGIGKWQS